MRTIHLKFLLAALGCGLALASSLSFALPVLFPPLTGFQDDDLDFLRKGCVPGVGTCDATLLQAGDRLTGVLSIANTFGAIPPGAPIAGGELTGTYDLRVAATTALGINDPISGLPLFQVDFAPVGGATGTMIQLFFEPDPVANPLSLSPPNCADLATCQFAAGLGDAGSSPYLDLGFTAASGFMTFVAPVVMTGPGSIQTAPASANVGTGNYGLNVTGANAVGNIAGQPCPFPLTLCAAGQVFDVIGSGNVIGGAGLAASLIADGAAARSDFDFQIAQGVPEPSSLALLGVSLLGVGAAFRRRAS